MAADTEVDTGVDTEVDLGVAMEADMEAAMALEATAVTDFLEALPDTEVVDTEEVDTAATGAATALDMVVDGTVVTEDTEETMDCSEA